MFVESQNRATCSTGFNWLQRNPQSEGSDNDMYVEGWNFMCFVTGSTDWTFLNYKNFEVPAKSDSAPFYNYEYDDRLMIGGILDENHINRELEGIVYSFRVNTIEMTEAEVRSNWFKQINSNPILWNYFTSMFSNLGVESTSGEFKDDLSGYLGNSQTFINSVPGSVESDGIRFIEEQTQIIHNVSII